VVLNKSIFLGKKLFTKINRRAILAPSKGKKPIERNQKPNTKMKMKKYLITEKQITTEVFSTSVKKAIADYFGIERGVPCMGMKNTYGNMRYSKTRVEIYRCATIAAG
jgi:hypothetical protein